MRLSLCVRERGRKRERSERGEKSERKRRERGEWTSRYKVRFLH